MPKHSAERLWSLFGRVWCDAHARLGPEKAVEMVEAGSKPAAREQAHDDGLRHRDALVDGRPRRLGVGRRRGLRGQCYCRWSMSILGRIAYRRFGRSVLLARVFTKYAANGEFEFSEMRI